LAAGVRHDNGGSAVRISDVDSGNQSCWVRTCALVLDGDGEDGVTTTLHVKFHAVTLAFKKIITAANEFTVNVEGVVVAGCDDDVGINGYLSKRSDEVLTKIGHRQRRHSGGTGRGCPDPFRVGEIETSLLRFVTSPIA